MGNIILEKGGTRKFEKLTRWNVLDYTLISRNSIFAKYSDDPNTRGAKLCLTRFRFGPNWIPYKSYNIVDTPIKLEDGSSLSKISEDNQYWLELNSTKDKVRIYREVV